MSYLVLARKYRPQDFTTVTGQEHVTRTLANAIKRDKVSHAHLFCGPRGVGKTSIARIFAKALNCVKGPTMKPCLECANCKEITAGNNIAVREIDGASHNSVDNVRELIESFRSLPPPGSRYKIYIIDEVHMLSIAAFNALLKSLEEPPPNTIFILATTEAHKIPDTVISRCVRHDFKALGPEQIDARLKEVSKAEKLDIEAEVIRMITRIADGSMRDAQSLLDRVQSFCEGKITAVEASAILGTVERAMLSTLLRAILERDPKKAIEVVLQVFSRGVDPTIFLKEFVTFWRELLLAKIGGPSALQELGLQEQERDDAKALADLASSQDLQDLVHVAREGADAALRSTYSKYALEALAVRMASREPAMDLAALIEKFAKGGAHEPAPQPVTRSAPVHSSAPQAAAREFTQASRTTTSQPAPIAKSQAAASATASASAAPGANGLDWNAFVRYATANGARMISEHLKRISVVKFESGLFQARGPKFTVTSLEHKDTQEQLKKALHGYSGTESWKIALEASTQEAEPGSILRNERDQSDKKKRETAESISNHPNIKSLQRVFPGSSIEDIKVKE